MSMPTFKLLGKGRNLLMREGEDAKIFLISKKTKGLNAKGQIHEFSLIFVWSEWVSPPKTHMLTCEL
jgi:hypothetical protein